MFHFCFPTTAADTEETLHYASSGIFSAQDNPVHPTRKLSSAVLLIGYTGTYPIMQDHRKYTLRENSYMLLFPGHLHGGWAPASDIQSHFWCHFLVPDTACAYITDTPPKPHCRRDNGICVLPEFGILTHTEKYRILAKQLIDASENAYPDRAARDTICRAYLCVILQELSQEYLSSALLADQNNSTSAKQVALVADIREYLRTAVCDDTLTVAALAEKYAYNAHYLTQVFRAETGMTLIGYIQARRMEEAKKLLLNSSMPVEKIALSVGFRDSKYFMKTFRRLCHVTPSEYRQSFYRQHINKQ